MFVDSPASTLSHSLVFPAAFAFAHLALAAALMRARAAALIFFRFLAGPFADTAPARSLARLARCAAASLALVARLNLLRLPPLRDCVTR